MTAHLVNIKKHKVSCSDLLFFKRKFKLRLHIRYRVYYIYFLTSLCNNICVPIPNWSIFSKHDVLGLQTNSPIIEYIINCTQSHLQDMQ